MDILSTVVLGITAFFLLFGTLFGLKRGAVRSAVRLGIVAIAFLVAWLCKKEYVTAILEFEMEGQSLGAVLTEGLGEAGALAGIITPLVESLLGVVLFITVFITLKVITAFVFFIIGFFLPKGKRGVGAVIGLLQGALIAFAICAPLNGLFCNVGQILSLEVNGEALLPAETQAEMKEAGVDFDAYRESAVSKLYTAIGGGFYNDLASSETEDGKSVSLSGAVEAVEAVTKFAGVIESIGSIDISDGLTAENREDLRTTFKELNDIKNGMSTEAKDTVNALISSVISEAAGEEELPEEVTGMLESFDFSTVDFEREGDVFINLMDYAENEGSGEVTATELVNSLAESTMIVPMVESMIDTEEGSDLGISDAQKSEISAAIDQLEDTDKAESLRKIFGIQ